MPKKPIAAGNREPCSGVPIDAAPFVRAALDETAAKLGRTGTEVIRPGPLLGLPLPSLAARWVLQSECWPLGRMCVVSGAPKSWKSLFAIEIGRWHALANGYIYRCEAESKENPDFFSSLLRGCEDRLFPSVWCDSLEAWQRQINLVTKNLKKQFLQADGPGKTIPICEIVDSFTSLASERSLHTMDKEACATPHFPDEAMKIAEFLRCFPQKIVGWPFSLVGVNHVKHSITPQGIVQERMPGGEHISYLLTYNIRLVRVGDPRLLSTSSVGRVIVTTVHNSQGLEHKSVHLPIRFWQETAQGVKIPCARFEWHNATVQLLQKGLGMNAAERNYYLPKIKNILDIHERNAGAHGLRYWSKRLQISTSDALPATQFGETLERFPDVLGELYELLGINRMRFFPPAIDYLKTRSGYEHVLAQAEATERYLTTRDKVLQEEEQALQASSLELTDDHTDELAS